MDGLDCMEVIPQTDGGGIGGGWGRGSDSPRSSGLSSAEQQDWSVQ